jgi:AraC-like DNA-binding protein
MPFTVSTDSVARKEQQEYWRSVLERFYFGVTSEMPTARDEGYDSRMERLLFGDLVVDRVRAEATRITRTPRLTRTSPSEAVQLTVLRAGRALVSQDGRTSILTHPGDLVFVDTSRPYVYEFDCPTDQVGVQIPKPRVLSRLPELAGLTAVAVPGATGLAALASSLVTALPEHTEDRTDPVAHSTSDTVLDLAAQAVRDHCGLSSIQSSPKELLLLRAQQFMRDNLRNPELTPADAARAISVSERYLFILFKQIGIAPASWLRNERLERANQLLVDPRHQHWLIRDIGVIVGYPQSAHFSRAFRQRYAMTPQELRSAALSTTKSFECRR